MKPRSNHIDFYDVSEDELEVVEDATSSSKELLSREDEKRLIELGNEDSIAELCEKNVGLIKQQTGFWFAVASQYYQSHSYEREDVESDLTTIFMACLRGFEFRDFINVEFNPTTFKRKKKKPIVVKQHDPSENKLSTHFIYNCNRLMPLYIFNKVYGTSMSQSDKQTLMLIVSVVREILKRENCYPNVNQLLENKRIQKSISKAKHPEVETKKIIDLFRLEPNTIKLNQPVNENDDEPLEMLDNLESTIDYIGEVEENQFRSILLDVLTEEEREVILSLDAGYTITETMESLGIKRNIVNNRKASAVKKITKLVRNNKELYNEVTGLGFRIK